MRRIFGNWWFVTGLIVVLLVLTLCVGLPYFVDWLRPMWVRLTIGGVLVGGWLLWAFLRRRKARKASEAIANALATPSAADQESAAVAARMKEALDGLKTQAGGKRDYLYAKPWYVIIGPPGAGKTTALLNSGLRFPFADQSIKGVGGTRNLDFWFSDEAAMVDTAGRYTTQDSDASVDNEGWRSFLKTLKKSRPLSPINGVIVAIGVDELLRSDRSALDRHASLVRRRLTEVRSTLEVQVPVYLLLTKADLIAGFVEYYDDLDVEGRRAVLGATLPGDLIKPSVDDVVVEFDRLVMAQGDRQAKRLFEEVDNSRRSLILGFPTQLAALRSRLARFVDGAFISGDQPSGQFRGFYFTSGVQEGAPLDRILAGVADAFQAGGMATRGGSGRTYFLNRLLTEVVFKEAGLLQADPAARARQKARLMASFGVVAACAALVLAAWTVSFVKNRSFLVDLARQSQQIALQERQIGLQLGEVRSTDPDLEQALPVLNALRNLPQGYAQRKAGEPGLTRRFGLYQTSHSEQAIESYRNALRRILLPRILLRLEQYMAAHGSEPMQIYQPLKVYLMLGGMGPMDAGTVKQWVSTDWADEVMPGADRGPGRQQLEAHLAAMLEDKALSSAWPGGRRAPLDGNTIAAAQSALQTLSLADRAYAVLKQKALGSGEMPWRADAALAAGDAQAFANGADVMAMEIPFFFTRAGYEKSYLPGLTTIAQDFQKDLWVMGAGAASQSVRMQMNQIRPNVARLYAREYIDSWERVVTLPKPAAYFSDPAALGAFTKAPSPLKILLLELRKNTSFEGGAAGAKEIIDRRLQSTRFARAITEAQRLQSGENFDAGTEVANYFRSVQAYVGDGSALAPIDDFVAAIKQAGSAVSSANMAGGGMGSEAAQGAMVQAMGSVNTSAGGAPPQLQDFVKSAAGGGSKATVSAAQGALSDAWGNAVLPECKLATEDKYPFFGTAKDDADLLQVQKVFAMNGTLDAFNQQRIRPLLDTSGPIWRWNAQDIATANLSPQSPTDFFKATQLRDLLMGGLQLQFEPKSFGGTIDAAVLETGSGQTRFDKAKPAPRPVIWSAQGNVPEATLTLFTGTEPAAKFPATGPWALFRLMDQARLENAGPRTIVASFGSGAQSVAFKVTLPNEQNPFIRGGGVWSFRCPAVL